MPEDSHAQDLSSVREKATSTLKGLRHDLRQASLLMSLQGPQAAGQQDDIPQEPDGGRLGAMVALAAAIKFLEAIGIPPEERHPLLLLSMALQDADRGKANPMLAPTKIAGRPPDRLDQQYLRVVAAVLIDAHHLLGEPINEAKIRVARELSQAGFSCTDSQPKTWRDDLMSGGNNRDDVQRYRKMVEEMTQGRIDPRTTIDNLLGNVAALLPTIRNREYPPS